MVKKIIACGIVLIGSITGAAAQGGAENTPSDGFYIRAAAGISFTSDLEQDVTLAPDAFRCLAIGCNPDRQLIDLGSGWVAGGAIGFDYADGIRTELEYRYAANDIEALTLSEQGTEIVRGGLNPLPAVVNDEFTAHFLMTNVFYDFRNSSRLTPFVGIGVGGAFTENENGDRDAVLAYQGRAGVALALNGGLSIDLEYIYVRSNDLTYGPVDEDFTPGSAEFRLSNDRIEASTVMLGLRKQF